MHITQPTHISPPPQHSLGSQHYWLKRKATNFGIEEKNGKLSS